MPLLSSGCGLAELASAWQDRPLAQNGLIEDWSGATTTVADGKLTVGALNDAERLYLYLRPEDPRSAMSLYRQGFTIWLGEGDERRGIRFPVEALAGPPDMEWSGEEGSRIPPPRLTVVDLLGPDEEPIRGGKLGQVPGVAVVTSASGQLPAVQIAIALHASSVEAAGVNANPGDEVRIALTTPELEMMRGGFPGHGTGGGPPGGGGPIPGGGGIPPGGGGMGPPHGGHSPPKPFDLSAKLVLATPATTP